MLVQIIRKLPIHVEHYWNDGKKLYNLLLRKLMLSDGCMEMYMSCGRGYGCDVDVNVNVMWIWI